MSEEGRLRQVLKDAYEFVCKHEDAYNSMQSHLDHWSDINHMFDVTGHDECGCVDCCEAEVCPDCHACLEHYECQCHPDDFDKDNLELKDNPISQWVRSDEE